MKYWIIGLGLLLLVAQGCKESRGSSSDSPPSTTPTTRTPTSWTMTTPMGINVVTEQSTIIQYNKHWAINAVNEKSWRWEDIDWITLDEAFTIFKQFYCHNLDWNCKDTKPYELTVYIKPWDSKCTDAETPCQPYEIYEYINEGYNCIDGWFDYRNGTVYIHLGDDPGTDHETTYEGKTTSYFAFEETALADELRHFFQWKAGRPQANNDDPIPPIHQTILIGYRITLPSDEEEKEE